MNASMAGRTGVLPGDAAGAGASGLPLMPRLEQTAADGSRDMSNEMVLSIPVGGSPADVEVDLREVYFLIMHFLANGPCTRAFGQLWNELLSHKLLPRRYHAHYARDGQPSGDENDDGLSLPLSYRDVANRNPNIPNNHVVDLLQQLLKNNSRPVAALHSQSRVVTAADSPTLLGSGAFSLLDPERNRQEGVISRCGQMMRWPHWHADQVHGLMLRELGGGFARHHRAPCVRTASYVLAKPSVFFDRIQIIKKLRGHRNAVYCAIFDRNGQHVITGSDDRLVKIWSTETGLCLCCCRGHEGDITDLAVNSSNKLVASASNDFSIRVWRLPDGFPVSVLRGHGGAVTAIAFSPRQGCEHHLLSSSDDGTCRIWDARDSLVRSRVYMPDPKDVQNSNTARGLTQQVPPVAPAGNQSNQILCCSFNADGSIFVTGSSDKLARVWNATKWNDEFTGRPNYELDTLQGHENDVNYVQFSGCAAPIRPLPFEVAKEDSQPRLKYTWSAHDSIVTCSRDGSAIIWTPRPGRHHARAGRWIKAYHLRVPPPPVPPQPPRVGTLRQRLLPTPRGVNMIVWSLDNRFVLAAIMDCRICVWNAVDGSLVHSLTGHDKQTYVLDVHPFNPRIAMSAGYDGRVIIWDIWDGHPIRIYETQDFNLVDGNFSPDGSSLVVSDEVGQIYLFATGEGNSQKDAKYDQFFLGDFRPLVRDTHGNVLDQETQLPPHERNMQDLLCDPSMIPYAEPYQTIYQQRRLGALGIDWQPPSTFLQVGTLEDQMHAGGPPDIHFAVQIAPASVGGNRWVEQPNVLGEAMDWEQEAAGVTEDSGSDYSLSEESGDDGEDQADILDGEETDEEEEEEEEEEDEEEEEEEEEEEVRGDITVRLRRSSRNKRKAELLTYSSSGRHLKRKRYDDGGAKQGSRRQSRLQRKVKHSRKSSTSKRTGASSLKLVGRYQAEPSTRPKRQAARNALHLFSSIHDDDEEELQSSGEKTSDPVEKASGSVESHHVLRSSNREELGESLTAVRSHGSKVDSSDHGECSRRPRSQRKLVLKLRNPKVDLEDSKHKAGGDPVDTSAADQPLDLKVADYLPGIVSTSENNTLSDPAVKKNVIRRACGSLKRHARLIDSSEDNLHDVCRNSNGNETHIRRVGGSFYSDGDQAEACEDQPVPDHPSSQSRKGKAAKRSRGVESLEAKSKDSRSSEGGSFEEIEDDCRDNISVQGGGRLAAEMSVNMKERVQEEVSTHAQMPDVKLSSVIEDSKASTFGDSSGKLRGSPPNCQERENAYSSGRGFLNGGSDADCLGVSKMKRSHDTREEQEQIRGIGCSSKRASPEMTLLLHKELGLDLEVREGDLCVDEATLAEEQTWQMGVNDPEPGASRMDPEMHKGLRPRFGSDRVDSADVCVRTLDASEQQIVAHSSGNNSRIVSVKHFSLPNSTEDQATDIVEEADNEVGTEGGSTVPLTGSIEPGIDDDQSHGEVSEGHGVQDRNWVDDFQDQGADEGCVDEPKQMLELRQKKALGDFEDYLREEPRNERYKPGVNFSGKPRVRHLISVLKGNERELRSRSGKFEVVETITKDLSEDELPLQDGAVECLTRTSKTRHHNGSGRFFRNTALYGTGGITSGSEQEGQEDNVKFERRGAVRVEELGGDSQKVSTTSRRTSARSRGKDRRSHAFEKDSGKILEEYVGLHVKDGRGTRNLSMHMDSKKKDLAWLLLTEVEPGTRYIPQFADDVVYLRQGHQEFLDSTQSKEKGPWVTLKSPMCAVEFCTITGLEYGILQESGQTYCTLTLKFASNASKVYGKSFKLSLPDLTNFPDFIVERSRYDDAMKKGWGPRDKCQVWWRSDGVEGGEWWEGRVQKVKAKSLDFPDSPWDRYFVQYKLDTNEPTSHSPWELFEHGKLWHKPPHIDNKCKKQLLSTIQELETSCGVGNKDEYGLRRLSQDVVDPPFVSNTPLPLDMETIKQRLRKDYYRSIKAFRHDIDLLLVNAQVFHGKKSDLALKLQRLGKVLEEVELDDEEPLSSENE